MLIAVPVAASLGVVLRFAIEQYQDSRLYTGLIGQYVPPHEHEPEPVSKPEQNAEDV
jgi:hypothetical protein